MIQSKLDEMWAALAAYQLKADADGHGKSWATMCKERTAGAAFAAALDPTGDAAAFAAAYAAALDAAANEGAQKAIDAVKESQHDAE